MKTNSEWMAMAAVAVLLSGCAATLPEWCKNPYHDLNPNTVMAGAATSNLTQTDRDMGVRDAEQKATAEIARVFETHVRQLSEQSNRAMKDFSKGGDVFGSRFVEDTIQSISEQTLVGVRRTDTVFLPKDTKPKECCVRVMLSTTEGAFIDQMKRKMEEEVRKRVTADHEKAIQKLDEEVEKYRKQKGL